MTSEETFTPPDSPPVPRSSGDALKRFLASLLTSKKFVALLVGLLVTAMARRGIVLQPDMVLEIVGLFSAYLIGQGFADRGKEAAQIDAQTTKIQSAFDWKSAARIGTSVAGGLLPGKVGQVATHAGAALGEYDDDWTRRQIEKLAAGQRENERRLSLLEAKPGLK